MSSIVTDFRRNVDLANLISYPLIQSQSHPNQTQIRSDQTKSHQIALDRTVPDYTRADAPGDKEEFLALA